MNELEMYHIRHVQKTECMWHECRQRTDAKVKWDECRNQRLENEDEPVLKTSPY